MTAARQAVLLVAQRGDLPFETLHDRPLWVHALSALVVMSRLVPDPPLDVVVVVDADDERRVVREAARRGLEVRVLTVDEWWSGVRGRGGGEVVLHDALCPLAAADFLAAVCAASREADGASVAAFRPVTDTVKTVVDDRIGATIDREGLAAVVAPVVVSAAALLDPPAEPPPLDDLGALVGWMRSRGPVVLHRAPSLARRVEDASAVNLLECVDEIDRRVRHDG